MPDAGTLRQERASVWLPVGFLLVSFLMALAFLAARNIYDDEIGTADLLPMSTARIIATMNHADVHPPGMYVLAHLGYQVIPSARWVTLFPLLCLYGGLTVFVLAVLPLFRGTATRLAFLLFAMLHPQLLMWGNSIRWYPWWTGVALLAVVVAQDPRDPERRELAFGRAAGLGLLLGCMFYLNYITIIFSLALVAGMVVRYGWRVWRPLVVTAFVALAIVAPQLHAFLTVHLRGSGGQRSKAAVSTARLLQSLICSEAFLPWHPMAVLAAVMWLVIGMVAVLRAVRFVRARPFGVLPDDERCLISLLVLSFMLVGLVAVTGLGGKPRNGLVLVPLLAPAMALAVGSLRRREIRLAAMGFFVLWSGWGIAHLLRREGLTKSGMNNRPDEVLRFIESSRGSECSVVVTYDPVLSFFLVESHLPRQLVLTLTQNSLYRSAAPFAAKDCGATKLYVVQSYLGGFGGYETILPDQLRAAVKFIHAPMAVNKFSFDPDAGMKRRLTFVGGSAGLPDYRYMVGSGEMDGAKLGELEAAMPYLTVADGRSVARRE